MKRVSWLFFCFCVAGSACQSKKQVVQRKVEIKRIGESYRLYRNGQPYTVKGASVTGIRYLKELQQCGGNSIRLYNTEHAAEILDSAQRLGLTVTLGLNVAAAKKDLDYSDDKAVQDQLLVLKKEVLKYKDHPALLMWAVGNEAGLSLKSTEILRHMDLWLAVNELAAMIHSVDPDHPVTTMLQDEAGKTIRFLSLFCNQLDLLSLNSFKPLQNLGSYIRENGWNGPYLVSEYGASGYWLRGITDWYSIHEQSSWEKMNFIRQQYGFIQSDSMACLGSYAFLWDQKNEYTPTWFSLYTARGEQTGVIDALQWAWSGHPPAQPAPCITALTINKMQANQNIYLQTGKHCTIDLQYEGRTDNGLELRWEIQPDKGEFYFDPSINQPGNPVVDSDTLSIAASTAPVLSLVGSRLPDRRLLSHRKISFTFQTPAVNGPYRLYCYLHDKASGKTGTANSCFYAHN